MPEARIHEWGCQIVEEFQEAVERGVEVDLEAEVEVAAATEEACEQEV